MRPCAVCSGENGCSHRRSKAPTALYGMRRMYAQPKRNASLYGMQWGVCTTTTRRRNIRYATRRTHNHNAMRRCTVCVGCMHNQNATRHCTVCSGENGCSHRRSTRQRRAAPGFSRGVGGHNATQCVGVRCTVVRRCTTTARRGNIRFAPGRWAQ